MKRRTFLELTETELCRLFRKTASAFYRLNTGPEDRSS